MRHLVITVECDSCRTTASEDEAINWHIELTVGSEVREMDLCSDCQVGLMEQSRVKGRRRTPKRTRQPRQQELSGPASRSTVSCPDCGKQLSSASNLARHRFQVHQQTERPPTRKKGATGGGPATLSCPYCKDPRGFRAPGLALHIKANHPQALEEADYETRLQG